MTADETLYRFFDAAGALLYVGISMHLPTRLGQHAATKPWWTDVAYVTVEHYEDRATARRAEQLAIDAGEPLHNVYRAEGATTRRTFRVPDGLWAAAQAKAEERGEVLSAVIRDILERYVNKQL